MFMDSALLCLNASAGSGKTYRLVLRYLELLFLGAKPSEILTLTFTKKAAKEMEERIAKSIGEIYQHRNDRDYINKLECISIKDKNDFGKLQEKIHQIYHSFLKEDLKITTIDSFFQRIRTSIRDRFRIRPLSCNVLPQRYSRSEAPPDRIPSHDSTDRSTTASALLDG